MAQYVKAGRRLRGSLAGLLAVLTGTAVLAGCGTDSNSSSGGGGAQTIQVWEGYTAAEAKAFAHLVAEYEAQHPGQKVSPLFVNNDDTLQKVLTAVRGGSAPDVAYMFGSWSPNIAQIPQVVNLTQVVKRPGEVGRLLDRRARRGDRRRQGHRRPGPGGQPGDRLQQEAVRQGRGAPPSPDWTWDDFAPPRRS